MASGSLDPRRAKHLQEREETEEGRQEGEGVRGEGGRKLRRTRPGGPGKGGARGTRSGGQGGRTERYVGGEVLCWHLREVSTGSLTIHARDKRQRISAFLVPWPFFFSRKSLQLKSRKKIQ